MPLTERPPSRKKLHECQAYWCRCNGVYNVSLFDYFYERHFYYLSLESKIFEKAHKKTVFHSRWCVQVYGKRPQKQFAQPDNYYKHYVRF